MGEFDTWAEVVPPIVQRCEVAAALGQKTTFNAVGSKAMAEPMKAMADRLDTAVRERRNDCRRRMQ